MSLRNKTDIRHANVNHLSVTFKPHLRTKQHATVSFLTSFRFHNKCLPSFTILYTCSNEPSMLLNLNTDTLWFLLFNCFDTLDAVYKVHCADASKFSHICFYLNLMLLSTCQNVASVEYGTSTALYIVSSVNCVFCLR